MDGIIQTIHWGTKVHPASTLPQWSDLWVAYPVIQIKKEINVKMQFKKKLLKQGKLNVAQNEKSNFKCFFFVGIASVKHFGMVHTVAVKQQTYYKVKKERKNKFQH